MSASSVPQFPDYGESGDMAGARRSRRAFRLTIVFTVLFAGMLWFSETYLKYEQPEYLFRSAITLHRESARVLLLQAIKEDAESLERRTPIYSQAFAVRAEDDIILEAYEEAYQLDPTNSLFTLRYGCQLFLMGHYDRAIEKFRHAAEYPPENALPHYLIAASIAESGATEASTEEAMVVVARTNNGGERIVFPRPLWFSPDLPQDGIEYANQYREIIDEACAPLYHLIGRVEKTIAEDPPPNAKSWLIELGVMGERLAAESEPIGTIQAIAGLNIRLRAIENTMSLDAMAPPDESLADLKRRIGQALEQINAFEERRDERVASAMRELTFPFPLLAGALGVAFCLYLLLIVIHKSLGIKKSAWTVSHSPLGRGVLLGGALLLLVLLHVLTMIQQIPGSQEEYAYAVATMFAAAIAILFLFGAVYPATRLDGPEEVSRRTGRPEEFVHLLHFAKRSYRRAYFSLALRYYGILCGLFLVLSCVWVVTYRIAVGLWDLNG